MLIAFFARWIGCMVSLCAGALIFPGSCDAGGVLLTLLYVFLKPLFQVIILPVNLFVAGLLTPVADGLLVWWTSAWIPGIALGYGQSVLIAVCISLCYLPYSYYKKHQVLRIV